jgi:hypothetical protein
MTWKIVATWEGGAYIHLHFDYLSAPAFEVINVWDYGNDRATIAFRQSALADKLAEWIEDAGDSLAHGSCELCRVYRHGTVERMTRTRDIRPFVNDRRSYRWDFGNGMAAGSQYRALCEDGEVRIATATAEPDTYFSVPARITVRVRSEDGASRSVTVSGFVMARPEYEREDMREATGDAGPVYQFVAYRYRKNWRAVTPVILGGNAAESGEVSA